jgi:hypothetical protein
MVQVAATLDDHQGSFKKITPGTWRGVVNESEAGTSGTGNPTIIFKCKVVDDGCPENDAEFWVVLSQQEKALWKFRDFAVACGQEEACAGPFDTDIFNGCEFNFACQDKEFNKDGRTEMRTDITDFFPVT